MSPVHLSAHPRRTVASLGPGRLEVDLAGADEPAAFHDQIVAALDFPDHYGRNLDALWDCLTDLTEPTVLVWRDWQPLAVHHSAWWAKVIRLLTDRAGSPGFELVLVR